MEGNSFGFVAVPRQHKQVFSFRHSKHHGTMYVMGLEVEGGQDWEAEDMDLNFIL